MIVRSHSGKGVAADRPLPSRQDRSRATTERLLAAAQDLLCEGGADAATLRAIAARAGVSLAVVYRRFPDKDAVIRAVYTRFFVDVAAGNAHALSGQHFKRDSLREAAAAVVGGIAAGYRRNRRLVRALVLYARTHPDAEFRRRAAEATADAFAGLAGVIEPHFTEISHPSRRAAVQFALAAVTSVLADRILFADASTLPPMPDKQLTKEATRLFTAYLQCGRVDEP